MKGDGEKILYIRLEFSPKWEFWFARNGDQTADQREDRTFLPNNNKIKVK